MVNKDPQTFDIRFPVAFGSGLAAALLFIAALQQGTGAALALAALSPLPIMIATLGFGHVTGLGAAFASAITITALITASATEVFSLKILLVAGLRGLIFALGLSLPSWWLARLASSGKAQVIMPRLAAVLRLGRPKSEPEAGLAPHARYPFGDILLSLAAITVVVVTAATLALILRQGGFETGFARTVAHVEPMVLDILSSRELPKNFDLLALSRLIVEIMPAVASGLMALALAANLWLSGKVVELSHRLPQPWPDIPSELRVPRFAGVLFIIAFGLVFLHGPIGMLAGIPAAALGILFVLQGLAVVHDLSRGMKFRMSLLCGFYLALSLLLPYSLTIVAIIGLLEAGFGLRSKKAQAATAQI